MAANTITVQIIGDASKLSGALSKSTRDLESFSSKMQTIGRRMVAIGSGMTIAITAPLALLGKKAFDAASSLHESIQFVNHVFGSSAPVIQEWAKTAATSMGMSRQEALQAAGTFGNLFISMGLAVPAAKNMSQSLVQLAIDLASMKNTTPEQALEALQSAMVGQIRPLRQYGVDLSAAAVAQEALKEGINKSYKELSSAEKLQLRYNIIMDKTKLSQGDFNRTIHGAANQQRILNAEFKDTEAKLGRALLPIFINLAHVVEGVANWFSKLNPHVQDLIVYGGLAAAALGPLVAVIGTLITVVGAVISPIGLVVLALVALVAAVYLLWTNWDQVWNWIKDHPAIAIVVSILAAPVAALVAIVGAVKFLWDNWSSIWAAISGFTSGVWNGYLAPVFYAIVAGVNLIIGIAHQVWGIWQQVWAGLSTAAQNAWAVIGPVIGVIIGGLQGAAKTAQDLWAIWSAVFGALGGIARGAAGVVLGALSPIIWGLQQIIGFAQSAASALHALGGGGGPGQFIPGLGPLGHVLGIPGFAEGGPVPGPPGSPQLAVVHGGEFVIPRGGVPLGGAVANRTNNYYVTINATGQDADGIAEAFKRWQRQNGS